MKKLLILTTLVFFASGASAQLRFIEVKSLQDYQTVLKAARQKDRMMLMAVHNGQGSFRKMFLEGVFDSRDLQIAASGYSSLAVDVRDEMGAAFTENFALDSLPSFYFMDPNETVLAVLKGYQSSVKLAKQARQTYQNRHEYDSLMYFYAQRELSDDEWLRLLEIHAYNFPHHKTTRLALEFMNRLEKEQLLTKKFAILLAEYAVDLETPYPDLLLNNRSKVKSLYADFDFPLYFERLYSYNLNMAVAGEDSALLEKIIEKIIPIDPDKSAPQWELELATRRLFAEETGTFEQWALGAQKAAKKQTTAEASANLLFENAYELTEEYNDSTALESARKMVKLSIDYQDSYRAHALRSYVSYLQKDYPLAIKEAETAASRASDRKEQQSANKLLDMIRREMD